MRGLLALLALLVACDSIQIYRVDGRVVSVDDAGRRIEIAHSIPEFEKTEIRSQCH